MVILFPFSLAVRAEQQGKLQMWGGGSRANNPSTTWQLQLDGRAELGRPEGRVQAQFSVSITAGRGGGRGMPGLPVVLVHPSTGFLHSCPHLLVHCQTGNQETHRRRARSTWWMWGRAGARGLASCIHPGAQDDEAHLAGKMNSSGELLEQWERSLEERPIDKQ